MRTVTPDQSKNYHTAGQALIDLGFEYEGEFIGPINHVNGQKKYSVFSKDGKDYAFYSMHHYNSLIYSIKLKKVNMDNLILA
jgi:hypothetical protein